MKILIQKYYFTSSLYGLGKTKGLNLLRENDLSSDAFILPDQEANLNEKAVEVINISSIHIEGPRTIFFSFNKNKEKRTERDKKMQKREQKGVESSKYKNKKEYKGLVHK